MPRHSENAWNTSEESKTLRIHKPTKWGRKKKEIQHESLGSLRGPLVFIPALDIVKRHPP